MTTTTQQELRSTVNGAYQIQKLRIQTGNRIVANFKIELGQKPGTSEEDMDKKGKEILEDLRRDHKLITDGMVHFPTPTRFKGQGIIDTYTKLCLIDQYISLHKAEKDSFKRIEHTLKDFPIWTQYLKGVDGIGPAIAAVLISEIDIHKATYPTSLWRLAGLDVAWTGQGRSKRKAHLEDREYTKKNGKSGIKKSITYKPLLKTKLMGIAASSFIKVGEKSPYTKMYYDYKRRLENHPKHRDRFIAINVVWCKEKLGFIPKTIVTRAYMTDMFGRCEEQVKLTMPDLPDEELRKEARKLLREILGPYEIYEQLLERNVATDDFFDRESLEDHVKAIGGLLRAPKEIDLYLDEDDVEDVSDEVGFQTVEEFDETPDSRGRPLYKLVNIGKSKNHRNMMAYRYIVKQFLVDLYEHWRALEQLPVLDGYAASKLGIVHGEASEGKFKYQEDL